jgi:tRNA-2-methylthio-N6-dimethylallyladenosine synthase
MQIDSDTGARDPHAHNGGVNAMTSGREGTTATPRVFIETYGCQMNLADSELMGGILANEGFRAAEELDEADIILVNTCAVRERAEERVFGRLSALLRFKNENPDLVLGVAGCMAERLRDKIVTRAPYVDLVIGPDAYRRLPELLVEQLGEVADPAIDVKLDREETYAGLRPRREPGVNGWVTIQRGCDKFCTFCIVPFVRGRERGASPDDILAQCRDLVDQGYPQVTLLGQTVNSYRHEDVDFADLLEQIAALDGLERIRFTSPYPIDFTSKLIDTMARQDKICNYVHLPVQSGSERMLEAMRRGYTRVEYDALVAELRDKIPEIALSTDVIVGFPGETEEDFAKTMELVESTRFDLAYLFKYSERDGTYAARKLEDDVPEEVKGRRLREIIELQESICAEVFAERVGRTYRVLVEGDSRRDESDFYGRTDDFKTVVFPKPGDGSVAPGDLVDVLVEDCTSHTLLGRMCEQS